MSTSSESTVAKVTIRNKETVDRKCADCETDGEEEEREELKISRKTSRVSTLDITDESMGEISDVLSSPGFPMDYPTRQFMERRFGHDFADVQVHSDAIAAESARVLNARAYTIGSNIVFGEGQYCPQTFEGKKLIAHELAHVLQQNNGKPAIHRKIQFDSPTVVPENPIEKILTEKPTPGSTKPSLGLTTPTVNGTEFENLKQARELLFSALDPKQTTHNELTKECSFADFDVKISAKVLLLTNPDGDKWKMKFPSSQVKDPKAAQPCKDKDSVDVLMSGKPSSKSFAKWIEANEQEHVDDLKKLYGKYLEPHFRWLLSLKAKGKDEKNCQADLMNALGNKGALVVRDFTNDWVDSVDKRDKDGKHTAQNKINIDKNCSSIEIVSSGK
jgi:hypothetical protein